MRRCSLGALLKRCCGRTLTALCSIHPGSEPPPAVIEIANDRLLLGSTLLPFTQAS